MRRVIAVLMLLCASCVDRTENLDFSTNASVELEIPEMIVTGGEKDGKTVTNNSKNGQNIQHEYSKETRAVYDNQKFQPYTGDQDAISPRNSAEKDIISEAVFYIFDENGLFVSKNAFIGPENYKLEFKKNGRHSVYVLCNISEFADLPASPSQDELESLTIPHRESYDRLPFAGKTEVNVTPGEKPAIRIKLDRINSAIRIENRSADRMELTRITINDLPNRGNIFGTDTEAAGVTYSESAEAEIDADGNAVVYSFFVPESKIANVKIEAEARVKDTEGTTAATIAPLTFIDRLETGKQATALVGYLESGNLKIGSPDNWGNVGLCELSGGIKLQVIGGEFFDYKSAKALRAYSGGSEFSCIVKSADGVATLQTVGTAEWVEIRDNIIIVAANPAATERECQVSVSVGGKNVGVFYIVQGKAITFSCPSLAITDNKLEMVGGTGSSSAVHTVSFDIDDAELEGLEIISGDNGTSGVTVDIDREAKRLLCHFMALVDASLVDASGVSVHVDFVDINGTVQSTVTISQRPAKITFSPSIHKNISYEGGSVLAAVTVETDAKWNVRSITDQGGATVSWLPKPTGSFNSGGNLHLTADPNDTNSGRIAYVRVQSRYTVSRPYEITQMPSYGISNISANGVWDAASNTLKAYSKGRDYTFTFETDTALPEDMELSVKCGLQGVTSSAVTHTSDNGYTFTLTVPDSDDTDEEVTGSIAITAGGSTIGSFTLLRAYKPVFISTETEVWGGVKDRPSLKKTIYRASEWDLKDFTSSNESLAVTKVSDEELSVSYAETLTHDAEAQTATITMNLNGGNSVSYTTRQAPVTFIISDADLVKLKNVVKEGGDIGGIAVTTHAGTSGAPWHVASTSAEWLTTIPAAGGPETNASGAILTVKFSANTGGDRTGSFVLESRNTTSPAYDVSQNGAFSATIDGVLYNGSSSAVFADNTLKAFSTAYDYTFNVTVNNAISGDKLSIASKTSGTAVTIKTQPGGTSLATNHSFVISVPASTLTIEPESVFDIMADGNRIGGFTVKQAKKPSISVATATTIGGTSTPVSGTFTASVWDIKSTGYVTSNNTTLTIADPSTNGTFAVNMKPSFVYTDANLSATITLVGVNGNLATCSIAQNKVLYILSPTSLKFDFNETTTGKTVTVTSSNAGTISSGMTATSSQTWCTATVSGNIVTIKVSENSGNTSRTATVYVTYLNSQSQTFDVVQDSDGPATVTIGGVQWTLYNLENPQQASGGATFATKLPSECSGIRADSHGKFYQWGVNVAWSSSSSPSSTPSGNWQSSLTSITSWSTSPCPTGYRLPTNTEWTNLINACNRSNGGGWSTSDYGYIILTDKTNSSRKLEFVSNGRLSSSKTLEYKGTWGGHWASGQANSAIGYSMYFNKDGAYSSDDTKTLGRSIRCVRQ